MQPDLVLTFLDLAESGSFHRTADRLGLTQSTVSARIAALEADLGTRLFLRGRSGAQLTTDGLRFAPHARALRQVWAEARRAVQPMGDAAVALRIGIQSDLSAAGLGDWVAALRRALPDVALYVEPDYSEQMCRDLAEGRLDFAVLYTPHPHPDLHFATLGEARYVLVAPGPVRRADLTPAGTVRGNYATAFAAAQREVLPWIDEAPLAAGLSSAVAALLPATGMAAYLHEAAARALPPPFAPVPDAPVIRQPVHAGMPLRHRTAPLQRALMRVMQRQFGG